jgi:hypothetical protein
MKSWPVQNAKAQLSEMLRYLPEGRPPACHEARVDTAVLLPLTGKA